MCNNKAYKQSGHCKLLLKPSFLKLKYYEPQILPRLLRMDPVGFL